MLTRLNTLLDKPDAGKLVLRLSFSIMMLFHGVHKLVSGIGPIVGMVEAHGMPVFIAWGVYVGEVVIPILLILGILVRPAALVLCINMLFAWLVLDPALFFTTTKVGAWGLEEIAVYFFAGLVIALIGGGKYTLMKNPALR